MVWNPFHKKTEKELEEKKKIESMFETMPGAKDMNMFQKFMAKRVLSLPPDKREKVLREAMTPKNIEKHKGEILAQLEAMKRSGQMSDDQYRLTKRRLGL
ncbi:MAG: hypothetical protein ABI747_04265 [Candidatus Moraniibacteriota bacterium]